MDMARRRYYFIIVLPTEVRGYVNLDNARRGAIGFIERDNIKSVKIKSVSGKLKGTVEKDKDKYLYRPVDGMYGYVNVNGSVNKITKVGKKK